MAANQFLECDPEERKRLVAYNPKLLIAVSKTAGDGSIIAQRFEINTAVEIARYIEVAEALESCETEAPEERLTKGVMAEQVADVVFGSRDPYYAQRVKRAFPFDGDVSKGLSNGSCVDVDRTGLIVKTKADGDFVYFAQKAGAKLVTGVEQSASFQTKRFNTTVAMLERRNPAVAAVTAAVREDAHKRLSSGIPTQLKALAPAAATKKTS